VHATGQWLEQPARKAKASTTAITLDQVLDMWKLPKMTDEKAT
jgi:hypothetical protein